MPRLIPDLLKAIAKIPENEIYRGPLVERRRKRKSLFNPDFRTPSFAWIRRKQSFLLDEQNPIILPKSFRRHKKSPPNTKLKNDRVHPSTEEDDTRELTEQDRQWWSNPYLRMMSSPLRRCFVTERILPTDLAIRLSVQLLPATQTAKPSTIILPDGLQHPRFLRKTYGFGNYIFCCKDVIPAITERNSTSRIGHKAVIHSRMSDHISHLLRLRVLQELQILLKRCRASHASGSSYTYTPIVRKLTREEWSVVKTSGSIPWHGAVALLIVPPLNKDPVTRKRAVPYMKSTPEPANLDANFNLKPLPPLSSLYPSQVLRNQADMSSAEGDFFPMPLVPVYNGLTLMPSRGQRAALYQMLTNLSKTEHRATYSQVSAGQSGSNIREEPKIKESYTFIIFSSSQTVLRADTVPLAIALWRIRMWEGDGYEDRKTCNTNGDLTTI